jgi:hypothetical protein
MAQRDNRGNDSAGIGTMAQALDEAAIDLDPVLLGNGLPKEWTSEAVWPRPVYDSTRLALGNLT